MKIGFRTPSIKKRIAARTSVKRVVRHSLGLKAPRGWGWLTNPKRAAYNRVYNRTTIGCGTLLLLLATSIFAILLLAFSAFARGGGHGGGHSSSSGGTVHVNGYYRSNGTYVKSHDRSAPHSGSGTTSGTSSDNNNYSGSTNSSTAVVDSSSPRMYNWEDEKGQHATNERNDVPKHVLDRLEGKNGTLGNGTYKDGKGIVRDSNGKIHRSEKAKHEFQKKNPCPATGATEGSCPGYVIDHIVALKRGGSDDSSNMQWQTVEQGKAKDKIE